MASENERETVADIVAEMRHGLDKSWHDIDREWAHGLADRIEAAAKREKAVGNAKAMHTCLLKILAEMTDIGGIQNGRKACFSPDAIAQEIRDALAVQPEDDGLESEWKATCAKCMDGDIEPRHCQYYGEPNGCNSPIYGEHPTTEKSQKKLEGMLLRDNSTGGK